MRQKHCETVAFYPLSPNRMTQQNYKGNNDKDMGYDASDREEPKMAAEVGAGAAQTDRSNPSKMPDKDKNGA